MHTLFLIFLLSLGGSVVAMDSSGDEYNLPYKTTRVLARPLSASRNPLPAYDLQIGQSVQWHTRKYTVTQRIAKDTEVTIVMTRDTHKVCGTPFGIEHITRIFKLGNQDPKDTISTFEFAPASINTIKATLILGGLLVAYGLVS